MRREFATNKPMGHRYQTSSDGISRCSFHHLSPLPLLPERGVEHGRTTSFYHSCTILVAVSPCSWDYCPILVVCFIYGRFLYIMFYWLGLRFYPRKSFLWAGCQSKYLEVAVFHDNYKCFAIFPLESLWKMDEQGFLWDFIDNYQPPFPHLRYSWTTSEQEATDLTFLQWLQVRRAFGYNHGKISSKSWKITKKKLW